VVEVPPLFNRLALLQLKTADNPKEYQNQSQSQIELLEVPFEIPAAETYELLVLCLSPLMMSVWKHTI
jgi:hypothetical protein